MHDINRIGDLTRKFADPVPAALDITACSHGHDKRKGKDDTGGFKQSVPFKSGKEEKENKDKTNN